MNEQRAFYRKDSIPAEIRYKLERSKAEAKGLKQRVIHCAYCGFPIDRVFSDAAGHKLVVCRKCKASYIINLGCFRIQKVRKKHGFTRTENPIR